MTNPGVPTPGAALYQEEMELLEVIDKQHKHASTSSFTIDADEVLESRAGKKLKDAGLITIVRPRTKAVIVDHPFLSYLTLTERGAKSWQNENEFF